MRQGAKGWASAIIALLFFSSLLAACGGNGGGGSGSAESGNVPSGQDNAGSGKPVEVTMITWESAAMNEKIMASMKKFEEENPDIKVKLIPTPLDNYGVKINGMITAKKAPDIFMTGNDMLLDNAGKGLLYDWTELATQDKAFMEGFYEGVVDSWYYEGKLVGLPGLLNTYGIFYNKKSFQEAGLPEPKIGWTYDEFFAAMEKLSSNQGGVQQFGYYAPLDPFHVSLYSVSAGGAPFADAIINPTKVEISDQFREGVEKYKSAIANGYMNPPTFDLTNAMSSFKQGKVPMTLQGQWVADDLIRTAPKELEWGYAPMPVVNSQTEIYDAVGWSSPATLKNPEAVWKVLKYLDSKMYEEVLPSTPVAPAAYQASSAAYYDALKAAGHPEVGEGLDHILKSPNTQPVRFLSTWAGKAYPFIEASWKNILMGKAPITELDVMAGKINNVITTGK
ncbi:ABC-type glycerol-3-phosphate transport system, substrate-binding protein [Paenibacillus sp. cl141a]|uniref:ABC transporter substrate-binding protein n=1 Tax=Paenibacillus sp. cl141a TaxID=1761877 RepID=UPI0008BEE88A|nr:sugar ABC transporter substrate-binding protein [Paenibacillus sp. cl141a]SEM15128.1 ABC-type glycerol-3-phosphate transport system, substrate-binding protein [Paenibacillus sp. cl141a]